jgi:hypothetical protein
MQPEARPPRHEARLFGLAKHGTTRLESCPGRPGPINQVVTGLPASPVERHGPACQKTVGTGSPRCRGAGHKPRRSPSRPPHSGSSSPALRSGALPTRLAPPTASSPPHRRCRHCRIVVTGDIGGSPTLLPCGSPALPWCLPNPNIPNPNLLFSGSPSRVVVHLTG